jgi:hypothetical protein
MIFVSPGAELKAVARHQPVRPVRYDAKLNGRMPLSFLSSIEPKYAALSDFVNKVSQREK